MNYYEVLGLPLNASENEIKQRYKELVQQYHPDKHLGNPLGDLATEKFKLIHEAYKTLSDPYKRAEYDKKQGSHHNHYETNAEEAIIGRVFAYLDNRRWVDAHRECDYFINNNSANYMGYALKAITYKLQGDISTATRYFELAENKQAIYDGDFYNFYGITLLEKGDFDTAISKLQKAINLSGEVPLYLANLAIAYESKGHMESAKNLWNRLEEIDPNNELLRERKSSIKIGSNYINKTDAASQGCCFCILLQCLCDSC